MKQHSHKKSLEYNY